MNWQEALIRALVRMLARHPNRMITLDEIIKTELGQIVRDTGSRAKDPRRSLAFECQQLRDKGILEFIDNRGNYRITKRIENRVR